MLQVEYKKLDPVIKRKIGNCVVWNFPSQKCLKCRYRKFCMRLKEIRDL